MKHLLISGGTRGIGAATVRRFISEGFNVTVLYSSDEEAKNSLQNELSSNADSLLFIKADVSDPKQVSDAVSKAVERFKNVDVLVLGQFIQNLRALSRTDVHRYDTRRAVKTICQGSESVLTSCDKYQLTAA